MPLHDLLRFIVDDDDQEALIRRWVKGKPAHSFREKFDYANVPFTTAGLIGGRLAGTSWGEATERRIFRPLGMTASTCFGAKAERAPDRMTPHLRPPTGGKSAVPLPWFNNDNSGAAGCVHSTARDLGNWLSFQLGDGYHLGKRLLPADVLRQTREPAVVKGYTAALRSTFPTPYFRHLSYGLGWSVCDYRGATLVHHSGGRPGLRTLCLLLPEKDTGVFVLSNMQGVHFCEAVGHGMLDLLLNLPPAGWGEHYAREDRKAFAAQALAARKREAERKKGAKPRLALSGYAGAYHEPAYGTVTVSVEGDHLLARLGKLECRLEHHSLDTFSARVVRPQTIARAWYSAPTDAVFRLSSKGRAELLMLFGQEFRRQTKTK
jgi:CubicO group peptidase (beta-lactamase class C family)